MFLASSQEAGSTGEQRASKSSGIRGNEVAVSISEMDEKLRFFILKATR